MDDSKPVRNIHRIAYRTRTVQYREISGKKQGDFFEWIIKTPSWTAHSKTQIPLWRSSLSHAPYFTEVREPERVLIGPRREWKIPLSRLERGRIVPYARLFLDPLFPSRDEPPHPAQTKSPVLPSPHPSIGPHPFPSGGVGIPAQAPGR